MSQTGSAPPGDPPPLTQAARDIGRAGVESGRAAWEAVGALRKLVAADFALSRSAFGLTLAWAGVGIALGASAWLLLMGLLVLGLHELGLGWIAALSLPALVSLGGAGLAGWRAAQVFDDTRLNATRRQLAHLGWGEDPVAVERDPERLG